MPSIEGNSIHLNRSSREVFGLLKDLNNFKLLLPVENKTHWESTTRECVFNIQGFPRIALRRDSCEEFSHITLKTVDDKPVELEIRISIEACGKESSKVTIHIDANVNTLLFGMMRQPLTHFIGLMGERLKSAFPDMPNC